MTPYQGLATVYDEFMDEGPVDDWLEVVRLHPEWLHGKDVADLGCGTGRLLCELPDVYRSGFGVDASAHMLSIAASHGTRQSLQWLQQDLRTLVLPKAVDLVIATCDVVNYLLTERDVAQFFQAVFGHLRPNGVFLFDILGPKRVETLQQGAWFDVRTDAAVFVDTSIDADGRIDYHVTAFIEAETGMYRRTHESHQQQVYAHALITNLVHSSGLVVERVEGDFGRSDVTRADRLVYYARRTRD